MLNEHVLEQVNALHPTLAEAGVIAEIQALEPVLSRSQRAADAVTEFCGSWTFIISFSLLTGGWIALNSALVLARVFDPYPYILLNLFLTVISTFQSPLIMMSQNRQMERDRDAVRGLHAKLDLLAARLPEHLPR